MRKQIKSWGVTGACILFALILIVASTLPSMAWGYDDSVNQSYTATNEDTEDKPVAQCPKTLLTEQSRCMTCHVVPDWGIKEADPERYNNYPHNSMKVDGNHAYYLLRLIDDDEFKKTLDYLDNHNVTMLTLEIHSWGGSAMDMWRIVGLMQAWQAKDNIIRTELNGLAASAGFVILASGTKGQRYVSPSAELMWHEAQMLEWPEITTPTDTEKKAAIYRHLQDNANNYLASVSDLSKEEIDAKVKALEFWITGREAVKYGFADGFIGAQ